MASGYSDLSEIRKDGRSMNAFPKPPKINLIDEKPRRESLIEQQLATSSIGPIFNSQQQVYMARDANSTQLDYSGSRSQSYYPTGDPYLSKDNLMMSSVGHTIGGSPTGAHDRMPIASTSSAWTSGESNDFRQPYKQTSTAEIVTQTTRGDLRGPSGSSEASSHHYMKLANELAEKEAKLKQEIAYMNLYYSPWARPKIIREPRREPSPRASSRSDNRWSRECPSGSSSRPTSRASSTRSTTEADLMEKATQLLKDVEELEKKPLIRQQILIEPSARKSAEKTEPIFQTDEFASSIHTAIIKVPKEEIDNKSPLPFAYDNFSTLGVRGNIASVGATEPETPYPPIFPTIKRTPSPVARR